jgi:hypothetical protein
VYRSEEINDKYIEIEFYYEERGVKKQIVMKTINNPINPISDYNIDFPFRQIEFIKPNGEIHSKQKASFLLRTLCIQEFTNHEALNLEVLYTGQAFGENGKRITTDRLSHHEKAQRIFFDTHENFPEYDVWFLSMTVSPHINSMLNLDYNFPPDALSNPSKYNHVTDNEYIEYEKKMNVSQDQLITLTEAMLITYFNTKKYNIQYLNFPKKSHVKYQECYNLDFNSVSFYFDTNSYFSQLWSKDIEPSFSHMKKFFLHDPKVRKDIFDFSI